MKKSEIAILEKAFRAEINGALGNTSSPLGYTSSLLQTKSKVAQQLVTDGYLVAATETMQFGRFPVEISGYLLTHAGRLAYCLTCEDEQQ